VDFGGGSWLRFLQSLFHPERTQAFPPIAESNPTLNSRYVHAQTGFGSGVTSATRHALVLGFPAGNTAIDGPYRAGGWGDY